MYVCMYIYIYIYICCADKIRSATYNNGCALEGRTTEVCIRQICYVVTNINNA